MRWRQALLLAVLSTACNSILDNTHHYLVVPDENGDGGSDGSAEPDGPSENAVPAVAGAPDQNRSCVDVVCDDAPAPHCESDSELRSYEAVGSCDGGVCSYTEHLIDCECHEDTCTTIPAPQ